MHPDAKTFLNQYPTVDTVEALVTDCNGTSRGKWLPIHKLSSLLTNGMRLPKSAVAQDIWGRDVPRIAFDNGDIDGICLAVPGSIAPILGERGINQAQVILTMFKDGGEPFLMDPRQVLARLLNACIARGFSPRIAIELEFSLFNRPLDGQSAREALPAYDEIGGNLYGLSALDDRTDLLAAVRQGFAIQSLPYEGVLKESAPAQYEINVSYSDDPLVYCDQIIRMQRGLSAIATRFNARASFMPKPIENQAGNGMHIHCSLLDESGKNLFDSQTTKGISLLQKAVAGCLALMSETHLIFAPSFNAYRRFQAGNHAPTQPNWGKDNRTTALRIPAGPNHSTRIEHRVAGADANPYLAVAAMLAGVLMGIDRNLEAPDPIVGNAWLEDKNNVFLPGHMADSIHRFRESSDVAEYLSKPFQTAFSEIKQQELTEFEGRVTDFELETYLYR